jgi:hypothetical protein
MLGYPKNLSLSELVLYKKKMEELLPEGEFLPDDVVEMAQVATQLLEGKIDRAARFRAGLMANIEACQAQLKYLEEMLEMTEELMKKAIHQSGETKLDGSYYSLRLVKNGGKPSCVIDPEAKIPTQLSRVRVEHSFYYNDKDFLFWARAHLGRLVEWKEHTDDPFNDPFKRLDLSEAEAQQLKKIMQLEPSKTLISEALSRDSDSVPGCRLERGTHLRVKAGCALPQVAGGFEDVR